MKQYRANLPRAAIMCVSCGQPLDLQSVPGALAADDDDLPTQRDRCPRCGVWFISHPPLQIELVPRAPSVAELLRRSENQQFDFKEHLEPSYFSKLAKHITAFANTDGGEIFIGVSNAPRQFVGLFEAGDKRAEAEYQHRLREGVLPKIVPQPVIPYATFITDAVTNRVGMLISIPPGSYANYSTNGRIYVRRGDKSVPLSSYEANQRLREQGDE